MDVLGCIVVPGVHDSIKAFYRKEEPGEELDGITDSQFISAVLSCVVNYIYFSESFCHRGTLLKYEGAERQFKI